MAHAQLNGENRLRDDPDWPANISGTGIPSKLVYRYPVEYLSAQWRVASLFLGQMSREWGPRGVAGIPVSGWGYPYHHAAFNVGTRDIRLQGVMAKLEDQTDTAGQRIHRYQVAQRLGVQITPSVNLALWQTAIIAGVDRGLDTRWITPVGVMLLGNTFGTGDQANLMIGGDGRIVLRNGMALEGQLAIDDWRWFSLGDTSSRPNRWALTGSVMGPVGSRGSWRALYTQVSTYAFRTTRPEEDYVNVGVGLGRQFVDGDQLTVTTTWPLRHAWTVTPEATLLRQGVADHHVALPRHHRQGGFPERHGRDHRTTRLRGARPGRTPARDRFARREPDLECQSCRGSPIHHGGGATGSDAADWPARGAAVSRSPCNAALVTCSPERQRGRGIRGPFMRGGEATQHVRNVPTRYNGTCAESMPGCGWGDSNSHELALNTFRTCCVYQFRHTRHHVLALWGSGCCDASSQRAMPLAGTRWCRVQRVDGLGFGAAALHYAADIARVECASRADLRSRPRFPTGAAPRAPHRPAERRHRGNRVRQSLWG